MDALALLTYAAEWGLVGIILWYVIGILQMHEWATKAARALLVLLGVLAMIAALMGSPRPVTRVPLLTAPPSIIR